MSKSRLRLKHVYAANNYDSDKIINAIVNLAKQREEKTGDLIVEYTLDLLLPLLIKGHDRARIPEETKRNIKLVERLVKKLEREGTDNKKDVLNAIKTIKKWLQFIEKHRNFEDIKYRLDEMRKLLKDLEKTIEEYTD